MPMMDDLRERAPQPQQSARLAHPRAMLHLFAFISPPPYACTRARC